VARKQFDWEWSCEVVPIDGSVTSTIQAWLNSDDPMMRDRAKTIQQQQAGGLDQLAADLTGELRTRVYNVVLDCLAAIRKSNNELPRNSTSQLRRLFEEVQRMKFWPDAELDEKIAELRSLVDVDPDARSDADVKRVLEELGRETRAYLLEIDRPVARSAADLGISDQPIDMGERRERTAQALGLDGEIDMGQTRRDGPDSLAV
jgi:hypothetical protein